MIIIVLILRGDGCPLRSQTHKQVTLVPRKKERKRKKEKERECINGYDHIYSYTVYNIYFYVCI